ncbi:MAG TPA: hypothetical protein VED40_06630 [Azospirillaceae bacterium]|nr:hypothetical protein [Azospirillaceae bacterium]
MLLVDVSVNAFIAAILAAITMVGMALVRQILLFAGRRQESELEREIDRMKARHDIQVREHDGLQSRIRQAEDDRRAMQAAIVDARKKLETAAQDNYEVIHELGEPGDGRRLYAGSLGLGSTLVINKTESSHSLLRGARHTLEVWAETQGDAMRLARQTYPGDAGFSVSTLKQTNPDSLHAAPPVQLDGGKTAAPSVAAQ